MPKESICIYRRRMHTSPQNWHSAWNFEYHQRFSMVHGLQFGSEKLSYLHLGHLHNAWHKKKHNFCYSLCCLYLDQSPYTNLLMRHMLHFSVLVYIVVWQLKAGTVEQIDAASARQRLNKHAPAAMHMHATIELLEVVFSMKAVPKLYNKDQQGKLVVRQLPACKDPLLGATT
jgi:hypothetical protein